MGSMTHTRLLLPVLPYSSPTTASRGRARERTPRSVSSTIRSASVTGVRSGLVSTTRSSARKRLRAMSSAASASTCASRRSSSKDTMGDNGTFPGGEHDQRSHERDRSVGDLARAWADHHVLVDGSGTRAVDGRMGRMDTVYRQRRAGNVSARERLMDAAYAEIVSGGWVEGRMVDIAASAGVSRQTLYNVFGSKEGLLQAVLVREADALLDHVAVLLEQDTGDPAHAVSRTTRYVLRVVGDNPLLHAVLTGDHELLPVLTIRSAPLLDLLGERIATMLGERCPDIDPS